MGKSPVVVETVGWCTVPCVPASRCSTVRTEISQIVDSPSTRYGTISDVSSNTPMMKEGAGERKMLSTHKFVHAHVELQKVLKTKKSYAHVSLCTLTLTCTLCSLALFSHARAMGRLTCFRGRKSSERERYATCASRRLTGIPLPRSSLSPPPPPHVTCQ